VENLRSQAGNSASQQSRTRLDHYAGLTSRPSTGCSAIASENRGIVSGIMGAFPQRSRLVRANSSDSVSRASRSALERALEVVTSRTTWPLKSLPASIWQIS